MPDDVELGARVWIAPTAVLAAPARRLLTGIDPSNPGPTRVGDGSWVGNCAVIGRGVTLGAGCVIDDFVRIEDRVEIGDQVLVTHRATVGAAATVGAGSIIGAYVCDRAVVGSQVRVFGDLVHRQLDPLQSWDADSSREKSPVVEPTAFVGWGAIVIGDVTVGSGAYVCAGAIVSRSVPPGTIAFGQGEIVTPKEWHGALGRTPLLHPAETPDRHLHDR